MEKLRGPVCFSRMPRALSCRRGPHSPAWGLLCLCLWAPIFHVHNHILHILTSKASEKAKEDLEILILTVTRFRKVHLSCSQPMATAQMGPLSAWL